MSLSAYAAGPVKIAFVETGKTGRSVTAEPLAGAIIADKKLDMLIISRAVMTNPYNISPEPFAAQLLKQGRLDVVNSPDNVAPGCFRPVRYLARSQHHLRGCPAGRTRPIGAAQLVEP